MANRYTNLTPSQFNPLSLEEIMMVPLAKQAKHEATQSGLSAAGLFDVNRLQADEDLISKSTGEFRNKLTGVEDKLMERGVSSDISKQLIDLKRKKDYNLSQEGDWGKAQNAYAGYQANMKEIRDNKNMSESDKQLFSRYALERYKGIEAGDRYSSYFGADPVNGLEYLNPMLKNMPPQTLKGMIETDKGLEQKYGQFYKGQVGGIDVFLKDNYETIIKDPEVLKAYGEFILRGNADYVNYNTEIARASGMNPTEYLNTKIKSDAAASAAINAQKDVKYSQDLRNVPIKTGTGSDGNGKPFNYTVESAPKLVTGNILGVDIHGDTTGSILTSMVGNTEYDPKYQQTGGAGPTGAIGGKTIKIGGTKYRDNIEKLKEDHPETYSTLSNVAQGLKNAGTINSTDLTNPQVLLSIQKHMSDNRDYERSVTTVSDITGRVGYYSTGDISKDRGQVLSEVNRIRREKGILYMSSIDGKVYTYDELKAKKGAEMIKDVVGYVDADNNLPSLVPTEHRSSASAFASPQSVYFTDEDGKNIDEKFYMTRPMGAMDSPRYKADVVFNKVSNKLKNAIGLPLKINYGQGVKEIKFMSPQMANQKMNDMINDANNGFDKDGNVVDKEKAMTSTEKLSKLMGTSSEDNLSNGEVYEITNDDGTLEYLTKRQFHKRIYEARNVKGFKAAN